VIASEIRSFFSTAAGYTRAEKYARESARAAAVLYVNPRALEISLRYGRVFHLARSSREMYSASVENGNERGIERAQRGSCENCVGSEAL